MTSTARRCCIGSRCVDGSGAVAGAPPPRGVAFSHALHLSARHVSRPQGLDAAGGAAREDGHDGGRGPARDSLRIAEPSASSSTDWSSTSRCPSGARPATVPNNFVLECFVDELAAAAQRIRWLSARPLQGTIRARGRARCACATSRLERAAADRQGSRHRLRAAFGGLRRASRRAIRSPIARDSHRVVMAVDCGRTLDPGIASVEYSRRNRVGPVGAADRGHFRRRPPGSSNFDSFEPFTLTQTPRCEVHFVESGEALGGTGELGPVPIPPRSAMPSSPSPAGASGCCRCRAPD